MATAAPNPAWGHVPHHVHQPAIDVEESYRCQDQHQWCRDITWGDLAVPLLLHPLIVLTGLALVFVPLQRAWASMPESSLVRWAESVIGGRDVDVVKKPFAINVLYVLQMVCSAAQVGIWITRTYTHVVSEQSYYSELVLNAVFVLIFTMRATQEAFYPSFLFSMSALIDIFTVVPVVMHDGPGGAWLSLSYLRMPRALTAYSRIEKTGVLEDVSDVKRGLVLALLQSVTLVVVLGATVMVLEILGDPSWMSNPTVETPMGSLDFVQMVYWIFTTVSTVGYGDFSPTTNLSRVFVAISIVVGVIFFSKESNYILALQKLEETGRGSFKPDPPNCAHIVVFGGPYFSSITRTFITEIFAHENQFSRMGWPNLVIMSTQEMPTSLQDTVQGLARQARRRVKFLMGSSMSMEDKERARVADASLVVIMADTESQDVDREDQANIIRGLNVLCAYPATNLRLILCRPESKATATSIGIPRECCFSVNELKSNLFAMSCLCKGWSTMVSNLLISEEIAGDPTREEWYAQYLEGFDEELYGFCVADELAGRDFRAVCERALEHGVTVVAAQLDGEVRLAPMDRTVERGTIVYAIASSNSVVRPLSRQGADWAAIFRRKEAGSDAVGARAAADRGVAASPGLAYIHESLLGMPVRAQPAADASPRHLGDVEADGAGMIGLPVVSFRGAAPQGASRGGTPVRAHESRRTLKEQSRRNIGQLALPAELLQATQARAAAAAERGGHYLLIVLRGGVWQQVHAFVANLRGDHLPAPLRRPIVVLSPDPPPAELFHSVCEAFDAVDVLVGRASRAEDLDRAGVAAAHRVVMLAGSVPTGDWHMVDGAGTIALLTLENRLAQQPPVAAAAAGDDTAPAAPHTVLELHNEETAKLLTRPALPPDTLRLGRSGVTVARSSLAERPPPARRRSALAQRFAALAGQARAAQNVPFSHSPRFAAGTLFIANCLGALVARAYYTPGIIELTTALVMGRASEQKCFPWQVACPPDMWGRKGGCRYRDLTSRFLRPPAGHPGALPLGLYRARDACDGGAGAAGYVLTNPPPDTPLRESDRVFVLGTQEFALHCSRAGLLVGSSGDSPASVPVLLLGGDEEGTAAPPAPPPGAPAGSPPAPAGAPPPAPSPPDGRIHPAPPGGHGPGGPPPPPAPQEVAQPPHCPMMIRTESMDGDEEPGPNPAPSPPV